MFKHCCVSVKLCAKFSRRSHRNSTNRTAIQVLFGMSQHSLRYGPREPQANFIPLINECGRGNSIGCHLFEVTLECACVCRRFCGYLISGSFSLSLFVQPRLHRCDQAAAGLRTHTGGIVSKRLLHLFFEGRFWLRGCISVAC